MMFRSIHRSSAWKFHTQTNLFVKYQRLSLVPVDEHLRYDPEGIELQHQVLLGHAVRHSVHPDAIRRHGLAEAQLDPIVAQVFPVHAAYRLDDAHYVRVLAERVRTHSPLFLDVDFDYLPELVEMFPEIRCGNILFEVTDEKRSGRLWMELVNVGLVGSQIVVVDVVPLVGRDLDLAAEEHLVVADLQRLLDVLRLLEADDGMPFRALTDDLLQELAMHWGARTYIRANNGIAIFVCLWMKKM